MIPVPFSWEELLEWEDLLKRVVNCFWFYYQKGTHVNLSSVVSSKKLWVIGTRFFIKEKKILRGLRYG